MLQKTPAPDAMSDLHAALAGIKRRYDATFLNKVLNHPAVYPMVKGNAEGPIDASAIAADPANILLCGEQGAIVFVCHQGGLYEAHTQVLPDGRGAWSLRFVRAALHWLFTHTSAVEVVTRCPHGNIPALALAKRVGGRFQFTNPNGWIIDGKQVPADIYSLTIVDWMRQAPGLEERGHWFHEVLEAEYRRLGALNASPHPDDDTHDRYVGMACEMILGGMPHKAAAFYNRWAVMAGYAPISIIKETHPVTVDIHDAVIVVPEDRDFWVMHSRKPKLRDVN